jgi:hypothetical protein
MLHKIAMGRTSKGDLNLIYLDGGGNPYAFKQTADGVWHGPTAVPSLQKTFVAILALDDGYGLLALDHDGHLWSTTQNQDVWNQNGFSRLPNASNLAFSDFSAAEVKGFPLLVAAGGGAVGGLPNVFAQTGYLAGGDTTQPVPMVGGNGMNHSSVAVVGIDPMSGPPDRPDDTPTAVVFVGYLAAGVAGWFGCFTSTDGKIWLAAAMPPSSNEFIRVGDVAALVSGGDGNLQAILLSADGLPYLVWDTSGTGSKWSFYQNGGKLPNPNGLQYTMMAAAKGNGGNLQVVGISEELPYLIWQDTGGNWHPYTNPQGQGMQLPNANPAVPVVDLAMGTGNQGVLQVGYIGQDGKIYVNWQDKNGNWGWYGPLP